jgi:hypothetical protein
MGCISPNGFLGRPFESLGTQGPSCSSGFAGATQVDGESVHPLPSPCEFTEGLIDTKDGQWVS